MTKLPGSPAASGDYFYTPALKGLVQQLAHLAFFGDGISVVLGPRASGKTTLSIELQQEFMAAHGVSRIALDSELELLECVEEVAKALGLASVADDNAAANASVGEILADLRHYAQALAQDKKLVVLIIDDAHHLDDQAIGALISLLQGHEQSNSGLHLVLLSEPGLERRIDSLQIVDVALYDFEMPNFSPSELANFLESHSNYGDSLNSSKLQKIWAASRGYPGLALEYLGGHQGEEERQSDPASSLIEKIQKNLPFGHLAAIAVLVIILIASFFLSQGGDEEDNKKRQQVALPQRGAIEAQATGVPKADTIGAKTGGADAANLAGQSESAAGLINRERTASVVDGEIAPQRLPTTAANENGSSIPTPAATPAAARTPAPKQPAPTAQATKVAEPRPTAVPAPKASEVSQTSSGPKPLNEAEVFLMAQNPDFFTLQVVAASKRDSLDAYMQRQKNKETLKMYRGTREGKTWFVVVQGVYSTRALALNALKSLPEEQAKAGPWPRKFSSIQEEIETFRRN